MLLASTVPRPLRFTRDLVDRVVVARLSIQAEIGDAQLPLDEVGHFEYLLNCFRRLSREQRLLLGSRVRVRRPSHTPEHPADPDLLALVLVLAPHAVGGRRGAARDAFTDRDHHRLLCRPRAADAGHVPAAGAVRANPRAPNGALARGSDLVRVPSYPGSSRRAPASSSRL